MKKHKRIFRKIIKSKIADSLNIKKAFKHEEKTGLTQCASGAIAVSSAFVAEAYLNGGMDAVLSEGGGLQSLILSIVFMAIRLTYKKLS